MSRSKPMRRLLSVIQNAREPFFLLDPKLRLVHANAAWEALTGFTLESVVGLPCDGPRTAESHTPESIAGALSPPSSAHDGLISSHTALLTQPIGDPALCRVDSIPITLAASHRPYLLGRVQLIANSPTLGTEPDESPRGRVARLRHAIHQQINSTTFLGSGAVHQRILAQIDLAGRTPCVVTIVGEPGTGRRAVARAIHARRSSPDLPCICFDTDAHTSESLAAALFTCDPSTGNPIEWTVPPGATVVIGDLARLARDLQAPLAALLSRNPPPRDREIVFVSSASLEQLGHDKLLRDDLRHAVSTLIINVPPLRERRPELPLLAQQILERINAQAPHRLLEIAPDALEILNRYDWPGNLAELARVLEHAHAKATGPRIEAADIPSEIQGEFAAAFAPPRPAPPIPPLNPTLESVERRLIEKALHAARHNKSRAAELLAISRPRLYRRMKELGMPDLPESS